MGLCSIFQLALCAVLGERLRGLQTCWLPDLFVCCTGFDAENDDELTVTPSDDVVVHGDEVDGWYRVTRLRDARRGLVPASYLKLV